MDKSKKKKSYHRRKKRLQLDEDESGCSKNYSSNKRSESSTSTRSSTALRLTAVSSSGSDAGPAATTSLSRLSQRATPSLPPPTTTTTSINASVLPGRISQDAATPPLNENKSSENSEGNAAQSTPPRAGSASPDPNCAICLGKLENKSFTDSCFHQFCFVCLVEWSKVKAECPLCKQSFKSIVHNVRSYDDYDQYHIPRPEERNPLHELSGPGGIRFRYRTTVTDHRYATLADRINREIESRLLQRPSRSLPIPNYRRLRQPANSDFRRSIYLQRLKLDTQQLNTRRRVRETSPTFFRDNPAQTHRLVPWVNRELNALLQGHGEQVAFVLDLIMGLIKRYPIDSEEFYQHVFPYIGRHTRQFMQEFLTFARSPYHMAAYDRHSSYVPSDEPHHDSDSDSDHRAAIRDDGNDSDVIVVSPGNSPVSENRNRQPPPPRREDSSLDNWENSVLTAGDPYFPGFAPIMRTYRNEDLPSMHPYTGLRPDYAPTSASGWDSPTPGPSQLGINIAPIDHSSLSSGLSTQLLNTGLMTGGSIWTPSSRSFSAPSSQPLPSTSSIFGNLFDSVNLMPRLPRSSTQTEPSSPQGGPSIFSSYCPGTKSDSDDSDVEIIEVEKPWNERSPIRLSSGGDTDYDVMITGTTHINDPIKTEKKKKKHKRRQEERSVDHDKEKRKRSRDTSRERHSKKKRHKSRSKSPRFQQVYSRSRTRSVSPLRLTIIRSPDYQHKKFAYKTHSDKSEEVLPYRNPYLSNRSTEMSRSLSSSDSDSESHLAITSHRHSSKSKQTSIEIVEYRKRSSKSKKSKKHKKNKGADKHIESDDDLDIRAHHKHKKNKAREEEKRRKSKYDGHTSSGSHKKQKHKSKKNKHKEKKHSESKSKGEEFPLKLCSDNSFNRAPSKGMLEKSAVYTSDSDPDSTSEIDVESVPEKVISDPVLKPPDFGPTGVEFVEVDAAQAAVIDQELDTINKTLSNNDYINSLLTGNIDNQRKEATDIANNDPNRMVNPNDVFNQRSFKKHPFGHKKSSKSSHNSATSNITNMQAREEKSRLEPLHDTINLDRIPNLEDNIQSHDITSCSDIDIDKQLPSFLTFSNRNSNLFDTYQNSSSLLNSPENRNYGSSFNRKRCSNATASYESPTSSGLFSGRENEKNDVTSKDNETVDVDMMSDDSDVDITGVTVPIEPNSLVTYRTSNDSVKIDNTKDFIDVVGDSNDEQSDEEVENIDKALDDWCQFQDRSSLEKDHMDNVSDIDVENGDSDIECSLVEGHKTFEIDGDSENEKVAEKSGDVGNGSDIDVIGNSDDEIVIQADEEKEVTRKNTNIKKVMTLDLDSNSETDLDYNCEDVNSVLDNNDSKSESDTDRYEESEDNVEMSPKHITNDNIDTEDKLSKIVQDSSRDLALSSYKEEHIASNFVGQLGAENYGEQKLEQTMNTEQTVDKRSVSTGQLESPAERTSVASNPSDDTPAVSEPGGFRWTANPVYEARPLSVTGSGDTRPFTNRERSTPEQEYIINLPRDRTPSWEYGSPHSLASVSSHAASVSPDLRDRGFDEDFMPED
ncbi:E3 ubiquitin-protein ligase Topors-like [Mercenaria mercenaria]|uniref:E3 ubiquitin-protein ligase Topors-like n=1 Tax=Mercenaria mercenaria TaxID=6596 RepID=UPI00234F5670|nr:E3 ubiquitin-protein ligase Topors-like [Mercenaria mercenaria]XP_045160537.2 E3 ubiquitin-protein ligase Topors-like [Mercenaria mercenaria]XP_053393794.1 E3 ubiquitin-protein ligase Topors-like [Mercenaria mercenaria]